MVCVRPMQPPPTSALARPERASGDRCRAVRVCHDTDDAIRAVTGPDTPCQDIDITTHTACQPAAACERPAKPKATRFAVVGLKACSDRECLP